MIPFTYTNDEGDEITVQLPSINDVCNDCDGEGVTLAEGLRGAMCQEEFQELFHDEDDRAEYFRGGHGMYGVTCKTCNGNKVVAVIDAKNCPKDLLERYREHQRDEREYERECAAERAMGA